VLIAVINARFHLFQEATNQFTVVIVSENTNQMTLVMIDHLEMTEVQDIPEMTDNLEIILDLVEEEVIKF
jgi:ribosome maturation factor RimP